jgi:hypothetical protein
MWMKPDTGDEAMGKGNRRTSRGERGQRVGTDQPRNLGAPVGERRGTTQHRGRKDITARGPDRESERPIVCAEQRVDREG